MHFLFVFCNADNVLFFSHNFIFWGSVCVQFFHFLTIFFQNQSFILPTHSHVCALGLQNRFYDISTLQFFHFPYDMCNFFKHFFSKFIIFTFSHFFTKNVQLQQKKSFFFQSSRIYAIFMFYKNSKNLRSPG